ncbi:MAG: 50S ribosomal protein L31 [Chloroflexi bacterium]|nr:50S ribosomal protein L31 [Chloroflexota bacterium]
MKPEIHPNYYPSARVQCVCGNSFTTGSTRPLIRVEICSNCHPFYTGQQRIVDTAGQVERFRRRFKLPNEQ